MNEKKTISVNCSDIVYKLQNVDLPGFFFCSRISNSNNNSDKQYFVRKIADEIQKINRENSELHFEVVLPMHTLLHLRTYRNIRCVCCYCWIFSIFHLFVHSFIHSLTHSLTASLPLLLFFSRFLSLLFFLISVLNVAVCTLMQRENNIIQYPPLESVLSEWYEYNMRDSYTQ